MALDWVTYTLNEWTGFTPDQWFTFVINPDGQGDVFRLDALGWFRPGLEIGDNFTPGFEATGTVPTGLHTAGTHVAGLAAGGKGSE
jgi:hypothetical protein